VDTHKAYMPQIVQLHHSRHAGAVLCLFSDAKRGFLGMRGKLVSTAVEQQTIHRNVWAGRTACQGAMGDSK